MDDKKKPANWDQMTKEQLEKYFDDKTDNYAKTELSRQMLKAAKESEKLRAAELEAQLRPSTKGPGRPILIKIKGRQWDSLSNPDEVTVTTQGKYYMKNGSHYIVYRETSETGIGETSTTLVYLPDGSARLMRTGDQRLRMNFIEGKRDITHYATPFGHLNLGLYTNNVEFRLTARGGVFKLSYNIDASLQVELNTNLELQFSFLDSEKLI